MSELTPNGAIAIAESQKRASFVTSLNDEIYVGTYHSSILNREGLQDPDLQDVGSLYGGDSRKPRIVITGESYGGGSYVIPTPAGRRATKKRLEKLVEGHEPPIKVVIK